METKTTAAAPASRYSRRTWIVTGLIVCAIAAAAGGFIYLDMQRAYVYVDSASIEAPVIDLAPTVAGKLQQVFVNDGDTVPADTAVAQVGNELIKTKIAGVIISVPDQIGALVDPGQSVVEMIDPSQLRVVGKVDENNGLNRIHVGDVVDFTVDAFGGKEFTGVVDEVSQTSEQSGVVFNISDQRATMQFDVKARFDTAAYPELHNGMSARMWIYTQ